jgi:hypothetical protein
MNDRNNLDQCFVKILTNWHAIVADLIQFMLAVTIYAPVLKILLTCLEETLLGGEDILYKFQLVTSLTNLAKKLLLS